MLDNGETKAKYRAVVRWAMSPILSNPTPGVSGRRPAQQTALFPIHSTDHLTEPGPKARTGSDLAPIVTGPGGSISGGPMPCRKPDPRCRRALWRGAIRAAGWHRPPRSQFSLRADATQFAGAAGIFSAAGALDPESMRFAARAVRMDDQPVPWMRVCVQVLLPAIHARIHGIGRRGVREKDFCEEGRGGAAGTGHAQVLL